MSAGAPAPLPHIGLILEAAPPPPPPPPPPAQGGDPAPLPHIGLLLAAGPPPPPPPPAPGGSAGEPWPLPHMGLGASPVVQPDQRAPFDHSLPAAWSADIGFAATYAWLQLGLSVALREEAGAPAPTPPMVPSVTLQLVSPARANQANLTGLKWAFFDSASFPALLAAGPVDSGTIETTDGDGRAVFEVPNTTLSSGDTGWLIITDSNGTVTQNPPPLAFCAPVLLD